MLLNTNNTIIVSAYFFNFNATLAPNLMQIYPKLHHNINANNVQNQIFPGGGGADFFFGVGRRFFVLFGRDSALPNLFSGPLNLFSAPDKINPGHFSNFKYQKALLHHYLNQSFKGPRQFLKFANHLKKSKYSKCKKSFEYV